MAEIIDLTESPQPEVIDISSDQENTSVGHDRAQENKKRKKKKRRVSKSLSSDGPNNSSRAHSLEFGNKPRGLDEFTLSSPRPDTFIVDATAARVAGDGTPPGPVESSGDSDKLLLPSHVTVFCGNGPTAPVIPPPNPSSDDEQYIEYLDYEDRRTPGLVRYFEAEEQANQSRSSIFKCKNCGAEGDHKTYDCPIQICLTCGARDEHSTRSCPISKTCYTCGMKGHINKTCPNRFSARSVYPDGDCDHCGSTEHNMNECPTLWRIYRYVNDEQRVLIMQSREQKRRFAIGEGGEGCVGGEMWCYNCASTGHLGDDCDELQHLAAFSTEHSAFSFHNIMSGPFYDPATEPVVIKRERESNVNQRHLPGDWEVSALVDVGRRGKNKDKERLEKRFREQEDESEDWLNDIQNTKKSMDRRAPAPPRGRRLRFGLFKDGGHEKAPSSLANGGGGMSLLKRLGDARGGRNRGKADRRGRHEPPQPQFGDSIRIRGAAADQRNAEESCSDLSWEQGQECSEWGSRRYGPRYKGGYDTR